MAADIYIERIGVVIMAKFIISAYETKKYKMEIEAATEEEVKLYVNTFHLAVLSGYWIEDLDSYDFSIGAIKEIDEDVK